MGLIYIRAEQVEDCGNGLFAIQLRTRPLTDEERAVIQNLFKYMSDQVFELLDKEALMDSIADPATIVPAETDYKVKVKKQKKVSVSPDAQDYPSYDQYKEEESRHNTDCDKNGNRKVY